VRRPPVILALCACLLAAPARAAGPEIPEQLTLADSATTALERAAFVALPAVYQVDVEVPIVALRVGKRRVKVDAQYASRGTAFGVTPGLVVTARHVVIPRRRDLIARALAESRVAGISPDQAGLTPITGASRIVLSRARTEAVPLEASDRGRPVPIVADLRSDDRSGDMALLAIDDRDSPVLPRRDDVRDGAPVAVIGFGGGSDAVPSARHATLDGSRVTEKSGDPRFGGLVGIDVLPGDSGAPVLDDSGRVHGVVLRPATEQDTPVIGRIQTIRDLLLAEPEAGLTNTATDDFRAAMEAFWRRDYERAAGLLAPQLTRYTDAALVSLEERRSDRLAVAPFRVSGPSRVQGALLALGAMALFAAVLFGAFRLVSPRR
jgi:hypothetical protein